jgi:CelD/BcsL family acetyltransferase involved in cellulose biosynthesis
MVDVVASFQASDDRQTRTVAGREIAVAVHTDRAAALAAYAAFPAVAFSPSQSPAWIAAWATEVEADLVVATLSADGRLLLALALEVVRSGPFRVARFPGGRHANGNFPPVAAAADIDRKALEGLLDAIAAARPDIDLVALERLADRVEGVDNPFLLLPHAQSPNLALAVDLDGGFDALLSRSSGKRKRKKHRSQTRKFEAAGGFRMITASTPEECDRLLSEFFDMKRDRFAKMGVADVFADPAVKTFFRRLFVQALGPDRPDFVLDALEVGGRLRAVTGSSRRGNRLICEFGAIREDDLAHASPGDFLFFENIQRACRDGYAVYDFSVGDEPYKRLWCDIESRQHDVFVPLTAKGRLLATAKRTSNRAKSWIKNNRTLWALVKRLRKRGAGEQPAAAADD